VVRVSETASSTCKHDREQHLHPPTPDHTYTSTRPPCCRVYSTQQAISSPATTPPPGISPSKETNKMSAHTAKPTGPLAPQYITGVYVPSAILIVGTAAFKLQWLPLAIAVCAALGGYQFFTNRTRHSPSHHSLEPSLTLLPQSRRRSLTQPSSRSSL
jgi:hypothetical protein